jgi:prepilin-type N-terminal cleavage/methylation domain-containing protein
LSIRRLPTIVLDEAASGDEAGFLAANSRTEELAVRCSILMPCASAVRLSAGVRRAFTLVELLVVIAIIGTLIALLLPAVQMGREAARRASCINNLRQIGIAVQLYHDSHNSYPPGGYSPGPCCSTGSFTSWAIQILPYLERKALYDLYEQNVFNEGQGRRQDAFPSADRDYQYVGAQFIPVYSCPSDIYPKKPEIPDSGPARDAGRYYMPGSYRGMAGRSDPERFAFWDVTRKIDPPRRWRGVFHVVDAKWQPENAASVVDGLSNTIMAGEFATRMSRTVIGLKRRTFWAYTYGSYNRSEAVPESRTLLADYDRCCETGGQGDVEPCNRAWGAFHPQVLNFLLCDGSVQTLSVTMDMNIFAEAATIAGREFAPLPTATP